MEQFGNGESTSSHQAMFVDPSFHDTKHCIRHLFSNEPSSYVAFCASQDRCVEDLRKLHSDHIKSLMSLFPYLQGHALSVDQKENPVCMTRLRLSSELIRDPEIFRRALWDFTVLLQESPNAIDSFINEDWSKHLTNCSKVLVRQNNERKNFSIIDRIVGETAEFVLRATIRSMLQRFPPTDRLPDISCGCTSRRVHFSENVHISHINGRPYNAIIVHKERQYEQVYEVDLVVRCGDAYLLLDASTSRQAICSKIHDRKVPIDSVNAQIDRSRFPQQRLLLVHCLMNRPDPYIVPYFNARGMQMHECVWDLSLLHDRLRALSDEVMQDLPQEFLKKLQKDKGTL